MQARGSAAPTPQSQRLYRFLLLLQRQALVPRSDSFFDVCLCSACKLKKKTCASGVAVEAARRSPPENKNHGDLRSLEQRLVSTRRCCIERALSSQTPGWWQWWRPAPCL